MLTLIEVAKALLMIYFSVMEQLGKTKEESDAFFESTYKAFKEKDPANLPEV